MGKQHEKKPTTTTDMFFAFGIDTNGKPRGARFAEFNERCLSFVTELRLTGVFPASSAFTEIAAKLPPGRMYASGKGFIPNVRRDLVEKLEQALAAPGDESQKYRPTQPNPGSEEPGLRTASPITFGLPQSWESVQAGHVVLIHESPTDGWWESTVLERDNEILTLRFRDYPRQPTFQRHISQVALINPGPAA